MLHYMIEECEQPLVYIEHEVRIIMNYFELERISYGNNLGNTHKFFEIK